MKNVRAKTGTPLTYSINSIDGQPVGLYWEYSWEILNNQEGTADQKGELLNNNINSNKVFVTWLRVSKLGEVFTLKCHVKVKSSQNTITCERDEFINITTESNQQTLNNNVILTEDIISGSEQCKIYGAINTYKACCVGANKIKWIVQGGHIIIDPSNTASIIGTSAIKDASNGCSSISIIWDVKNASKYSITAYGVNGDNTSPGSTRIEKIVCNDTITPIITGDNVITIGEDSTATVTYTISEFDWSSFTGNYTLNIWFQLGIIPAGSPSSLGVSDDDYNWLGIENLAGGSINYYLSQNNKSFSKTIPIPISYDSDTPTRYRFKLINIEVVGPYSLQNCFVSNNGFGARGIGWLKSREINNDVILIFCPTENDFPLPPLDKIVNPPCDSEFELGDVDIIISGCTDNIVLGRLTPCQKPRPVFDTIVFTSLFPTFDRICFNYCVPPSLDFDSICIQLCNFEYPRFGQIGTINGIRLDCCFMTVPEFGDSPTICVLSCNTFTPELGSISMYRPEIPIFNPIPGKQICLKICTYDLPLFGETVGVDQPCYIECYSNINIEVKFGNISGGTNITPIFGDNVYGPIIELCCQNYPSVDFDSSPTICINICDTVTGEFGNIGIYGTIVPEFSKYNFICFKDCTTILTVEFGSTAPDNICYQTQILSDIGFYQLPCYCVTPKLEFGAYLSLNCQILSTPQVDSDFPGNITLCCQAISTPGFTLVTIPGQKLCSQVVIQPTT